MSDGAGTNQKTESPIIDTLWMRCLVKVATEAEQAGMGIVVFNEVEDLVLRVSKLPLEEMFKEI